MSVERELYEKGWTSCTWCKCRRPIAAISAGVCTDTVWCAVNAPFTDRTNYEAKRSASSLLRGQRKAPARTSPRTKR